MVIVISLGVFVMVLAVAEYGVHRFLMHRPWPWRSRLYVRHHVMHHQNRRNDLQIDLPPWQMLVYSVPLWGPALLLDLSIGLTFMGCAVGYGYLWSKLHRAFHNLEVNWTVFLPWYYDAAYKHHHLHHVDPKCNFGTVFIFTDRLFGTRRVH